MSEEVVKPKLIGPKKPVPGEIVSEPLTVDEIEARTAEDVPKPDEPAKEVKVESSSAKTVVANPKKSSFLGKAKEAPGAAAEEITHVARAVTVDFGYIAHAAESNAKLAIENGHRTISHQFQHLADVARHVQKNVSGTDHTVKKV